MMGKRLYQVLAAAAVMAGLGGLLGAAPVQAESASSLRISPSGVRLTLTGGKTLEGTEKDCVTLTNKRCAVEIENTGTKEFRYKVYITPYTVSGSNNELSFSEGENAIRTQISRWIKIKNSDGEYVTEAIFRIKPGEKQTVDYRIEIPENIPGGSQYAVIWAQIMGDENSGGGIQTVGQVGSVITGRSSSDTIETADLYDIKVPSFSFGGKLVSTAKVKNTGNTDFVIEYSINAKSFFGKEIHSESGKLAAYPETEYDVKSEWENPPIFGLFNVEFRVKAADQDINKHRTVLIMPVPVMIVIILLLTVVVVWIIIIIRKRKERQARKLV